MAGLEAGARAVAGMHPSGITSEVGSLVGGTGAPALGWAALTRTDDFDARCANQGFRSEQADSV